MTFGNKGSGDGQFNFPSDVAVDRYDNVWVVDKENHRIQKFDSKGNFIFKFGSYGTGNDQFDSPGHMTIDRDGNLWIANEQQAFLQKYDPSGNFLLKIGGFGSANGQFMAPQDLTVDEKGNIWVADSRNHRIQKFDSKGNFLFKFGNKGSADGQLTSPTDLVIDKHGDVWVIDYYNGNHRVQKFDSQGNFLMRLGELGSGNGQFNNPGGLLVDGKGNIWISDVSNLRIQVFTPEGRFVSKENFIPVPLNMAFNRSGNLYGVCSIGITVFVTDKAADQQTLIKGKTYTESNGNCLPDKNELPLPNVVVVAQPGNFYGISDKNGDYSIRVDTSSYTVSQLLEHAGNKIIQPVCPPTNQSSILNLQHPGDSVINVNFGNKVTLLPFLSSSVSSDRRRRCLTNNTVVSYSNTGYATASNVKVHLKLPVHVILKSADKPYTLDKDSVYVFAIGTLDANQSGTIHIIDSVACTTGLRGLTACTKVWITPSNSYILPPDSPWDQSDIILSGKCIENGRIKLSIFNSGQSMADSSSFRVFLDGKLALDKHFKLTAGDSLVLRVPANGKTLRLEADQTIGHPRKAQTNLTIEGCVATSNDIVSKGFVDILPQDDSEPEASISCLPIIDSYDPNDKQVSPIGTTNDHYTPTKSELTYTIRFQNTGTDVAYTVTVIDTLSDKLDIATLQLGAASHKYSFNVSGKGKPVLTFTFNNINLPDSTRDQRGSNGFVQFSIKPKAGLAEKARIDNFADIIFDYNEPVRTNTTTNILYDLPPVVDNAVRLNEKGVVFLKPTITSFTPAQAGSGEQITIKGSNYQRVVTDNIVRINGIQATVVSASETELVVLVPQAVTAGKVSVTTLGGTAVSEVDFVLGSEQPQWSRAIRVYPNPSQGKFTVDLSGSATVIDGIEVVNALGQKIVSQNVSKARLKLELDLTAYGSGMYLLVVKSATGNALYKIIVK